MDIAILTETRRSTAIKSLTDPVSKVIVKI